MIKMHRLLFIDDDRSQQMVFKLLVRLKQFPFEVECFTDPLEALKYLENLTDEQFPDVIISDIKMPCIDGFELADIYLEKYHKNHLKTIFIISSSTIRLEDIQQAEDHPAVNFFVEKPFDKEKVMQFILEPLSSMISV